MTYDDVADIKAELARIASLLEQILDEIESGAIRQIAENIHTAVTPKAPEAGQ